MREVHRVNYYGGDEKINVVAQSSIGDQENSVTLDIKIEGLEMAALLDTGARPSVINIVTLEQIGLAGRLIRLPEQIYGLCKLPVGVKGYVNVEIQIHNGAPVVTRMKVLSSVDQQYYSDENFLKEFGCVTFDFAQGRIGLGTFRSP